MFAARKGLYRQIEASVNSKLLVYVTGDRQGQETQIHQEALDFLSDHLDAMGSQERISLLLYSRGGHRDRRGFHRHDKTAFRSVASWRASTGVRASS